MTTAIAQPQLRDLLDLLLREVFLYFNCHAIATVQSFNATNQTVTAKMAYQRKILNSNGEWKAQSYPLLADCPCVILGGGGTSLTFPISQGDDCLILFNDRDLDNWFSGNYNTTVATERMHSFADPIALVGLFQMRKSLPNYDTTNVVLNAGSGNAKITNSAGISLGTLLQNLITQLETLCSDIQSLTVTCAGSGSPSGVPLNSSSFATVSSSLSNIATSLGELLA